MTPFTRFMMLSCRILEDEWQHWMMRKQNKDWSDYDNALPWFKFPRVSLE